MNWEAVGTFLLEVVCIAVICAEFRDMGYKKGREEIWREEARRKGTKA